MDAEQQCRAGSCCSDRSRLGSLGSFPPVPKQKGFVVGPHRAGLLTRQCAQEPRGELMRATDPGPTHEQRAEVGRAGTRISAGAPGGSAGASGVRL